MYGVVLGPCGLVDSLGIRLHIGPRRRKSLFIFDRSQRNFSDRDSAMLDALRPHLEQLLHGAQLRWRLREALALHEATQAAIVVLESEDRVVFVSRVARELLDRYFGEKGAPLPDRLASWVAERRRAATGESLRIDAGDRSLVVEFIDGALLLEERQRRPGLTAREQEILDLVAEGRTNAEIAERLWVSPATVRKHLENVYAKLGVHTRTAAAAFVREWLQLSPLIREDDTR
jgi:DNA-binding CsgD family transcriptional regulator